MPNIKIRKMHDNFSTRGVFLSDGSDYLCPKLLPGEVVEVDDDHVIFNSASAEHIEITREPVTRPYRFDSLHGAMSGQGMSDEDALEAAQMIGTSLEMSADIRKSNFEALQRAEAEGVEIPKEPVLTGPDGLAEPRADNAETIGGLGREAEAAAKAAPKGGGRRRSRKKT